MSMERKAEIETTMNAVSEAIAVDWTRDLHGNRYGWVKLEKAAQLTDAAEGLAGIGGRLVTVTAQAPENPAGKSFYTISYHFSVHGTMLTVEVEPEGTTPTVPSITPWHKAADWTEREFSEIYGITVEGHPNPRPLFLNSITQPKALEELVPLSTMTNSASSNTLWEKIMGAKSGGEVTQ